MKSIQQFAIEQLSQVKDFYLKDPSLMLEHYESERKTTDEYNGRQLLELIQNADDAAKGVENPMALICLSGNQLFIANTGEHFSEGGLDSILHSNLSPKYNEKKQIGNKGLGFRSILNWSDKITIKSGLLHISFSRRNSIEILEGLKRENPIIEKRILERYRKNESAIALLRCPEIIDNVKLPDFCSDYDTVIILDLKSNIVETIELQLTETVDAEMMLFLNHLNKIEINTPNINQVLERIISNEMALNESRYIKRVQVGINDEPKEEWNIYGIRGTKDEKDGDEKEAKNYELAVAWQDNLRETKNLLHSYFKTDVSFVFPGILHGTFELSSNRNELIKGEGHNAFLFGEVASLLSEAAEHIATTNKNNADYNAMHLAMVDFASLSLQIKSSDFENKLKNAIKQKKVFPTIAHEYIDWSVLPGYYEEPEFAEFLSPNIFTRLLKCCDSTKDETFIKSLSPGVYNIGTVINDISNNRHVISEENYAALILAVHSRVKDLEQLRPLFYDNGKYLLDFSKPIFFPEQNVNYSLPTEIGIQIISTKVSLALLELAEATTFSQLTVKLSKFRIKEFKFEEVVNALIEYYHHDKSSTSDVLELNKHIFNLFKNEHAKGDFWRGRPIPVLNKKGTIALGGALYFGKEYNNELLENIFSSDKSVLVAGPEKFGVQDDSNWSKYMSWTGVAVLPRKIKVAAEREFAVYSMQRFDFKNRIDSYYFQNGYNAFASELTGGYGGISVTSIQHLDSILRNNSTENILAWLNADDLLVKQIDKDQENTDSYITLWFYRARDARYVRGAGIKNYVKWKVANALWMNTESGVKQCPDRCTTANAITADFSPLIEKPKLDYDLLRKKSVNRDRVEYLLRIVGVHKSIDSFSTNILYSILLKLPEIDQEGKKVRNIYNQLAINYDEKLLANLDKSDPHYVKFHNEGKVFCRNERYVRIQDAYYVNDKRLGESVIKQFETIEIDRRRGKDKIRKLFGVKPLEKIQLKLREEPSLLAISNVFEMDLENFKPYIYVLRQDIDGGAEKNIIKDIRFKLVSDLEFIMNKGETEVNLQLAPYEYFYLRNRNTIFLKTPIHLDSLEKLKQDVNFCSSIAESFTALLDVDAQWQQIRELFSKTNTGRDEILRSDFDDLKLEKLAAARKKLGITNSPKTEFWKSFVKCFASKQLIDGIETDQILLDQLQRLFPELTTPISSVFDDINYSNCNEEFSSDLILKLFTQAAITIRQFNTFHYPSIDLTELYGITFRRILEEQRGNFRIQLYEKCISEANLRKDFVFKLNAYNSIFPTIVNEVDYSAIEDLRMKVNKSFNIDILDVQNRIDLNAIYFGNKDQLFNRAEEHGVNRQLVDQFINDNISVQSLLFFNDEFESVFSKLSEWASLAPNGGSGKPAPQNGKRISFGKDAIFYDDYFDLKNKIDEILKKLGKVSITLNNIKIEKADMPGSRSGHTGGGRGQNKPRSVKEEVGFLGEYVVYTHLMNTIKNNESVKWVSQYAKDCKVNSEGKDGLGYDIEYIPNGAVHPRYVEVKVVGWDNAFHISSNEVKFGEQFKDNYEIFLVRNIEEPAKAQIERIQGLFNYKGKSFSDNDLFTVINDNFILRFNRV